jgi:hypothetical protein
MSTPLSWEEQALSDPDALRGFLELCNKVTAEAPSSSVFYWGASIEETVEAMAQALEKNPDADTWYVAGTGGDRGTHLFAFCGNGPNSESKAYFIQLALQLLPVLLRKRLVWIDFMGEQTDTDYQLRHTES